MLKLSKFPWPRAAYDHVKNYIYIGGNLEGPNPEEKKPLENFPQVGYLKNFISSENIIIGDYTYYDDPEGPDRFESNALYLFPFIGDKLIIVKFFERGDTLKFLSFKE